MLQIARMLTFILYGSRHRGSPAHRSSPMVAVALALVAWVCGPALAVAQTAAPIEDELIVQTPMSAFIVEAMLKEFTLHAKERWNVTLRARAQRAGTPVSYERIVGWKGQPEADIFWGGEPALFNSLAAEKLLAKLELVPAVWEAIPASIGTPRPVPLKDPARFWVGTALEVYGIAYSPRLLRRLGVPDPREWDDVLNPKLKGAIVQSTPTRSSSSHATYQVILQSKGESDGWNWLKQLAALTGSFVGSSRDVPAAVARGEFAVGFGVPSYFVFEEKLAGFDIRFVAPKNAFVTPEPFGILAGARHPKAAREFLTFLLSEYGQRLFMERALFPVMPRYKVHGPPGSTVEMAVQVMGGLRSFFEPPVSNIYDDELARSRYREVNEQFRRDIETPWESLKKR